MPQPIGEYTLVQKLFKHHLQEEVPIHGEIQSDGTTDNGAGAVSSRASTALATEPPAEAVSLN